MNDYGLISELRGRGAFRLSEGMDDGTSREQRAEGPGSGGHS